MTKKEVTYVFVEMTADEGMVLTNGEYFTKFVQAPKGTEDEWVETIDEDSDSDSDIDPDIDKN